MFLSTERLGITSKRSSAIRKLLHPTERCGELTRPANAMLMPEANNITPNIK
jgi:hypothetical protein